MDVDIPRDWTSNKRQQIKSFVVAVFTGYTFLVVSTNLVMFQNSPINTLDVTFSDEKSEINSAVANNSQYGLTVGDPTEPLKALSLNLDIIVITSSLLIVSGLFFCLSTNFSGGRAWLVLYAAVFPISYLAIMSVLPGVQYFVVENNNHVSISLLSGISSQPLLFFVMLASQGLVMSSILYVWSLPLMPEFAPDANETDGHRELIKIHRNDWKQYGTWAVSLFGGLGIAASIAFFGGVSPYGSAFIIHTLILFGGSLFLIMGYVVWKIKATQKAIYRITRSEY